MARFIIASGWASEVDVFEAKDLPEAKAEAARRSMAEGLLDDDLADCAWAEPYSDDLAHEVGLRVLDERDAALAQWRSQAPWR